MRDFKPISVESHLGNLPLFSDMDTAAIQRIARNAQLISIDKGGILFHAGDACTGFYLLIHGQIKLAFSSAQRTEKVMEIVEQGQSVGEVIMFLDKAYMVFAQALKDSLLIHVSKSDIFSELERDHYFTSKMLSGMAKRTHDLMADVESYSLQSAKQRTIGYLMTELTQESIDSNKLEFELIASKGVVSSRLNITQAHFSRVLHNLSAEGLLKVNGKKIWIPSVSGLLKNQETP